MGCLQLNPVTGLETLTGFLKMRWYPIAGGFFSVEAWKGR